jgi:hypothetical protein
VERGTGGIDDTGGTSLTGPVAGLGEMGGVAKGLEPWGGEEEPPLPRRE